MGEPTMKIFVFVCCIIFGGYVIGEIVGYSDPVINDPFAGLTLEEINQGIPSLSIASGDTTYFGREPPFEEMAI